METGHKIFFGGNKLDKNLVCRYLLLTSLGPIWHPHPPSLPPLFLVMTHSSCREIVIIIVISVIVILIIIVILGISSIL